MLISSQNNTSKLNDGKPPDPSLQINWHYELVASESVLKLTGISVHFQACPESDGLKYSIWDFFRIFSGQCQSPENVLNLSTLWRVVFSGHFQDNDRKNHYLETCEKERFQDNFFGRSNIGNLA